MTSKVHIDELKRLLENQAGRKANLVVVYDGQCIFCNSYVKLTKLRASAGDVLLVDARANGVAASVREKLSLDLDDGMLVLYGGRAYYGADAMHMLSSVTDNSDVWNTFMAAVFRRPRLAGALYPFLKVGRRAALLALGRSRIRPTSTY